MAKTPRRDDEPARPRRVRAALAPLSRASVAATACVLWVGLALPGLQLLPGAGGFGDKSIAISLQSALLGIDSGYAASPEVRAAMRALGLAVISESPVPRLRTDGAVSLAVDLAESIRTDAVDTTVAPTLVSDGPHNPPSAETDTPVGVPPLHERPSVPAASSEPVAGGETQPTPPTPPSAPTKSGQSITFSTSPSDAFVGGFYVGRGLCELGPARELLARARQLGRLRDLRRDRQLRRARNVHRPGEPGRERELPGGAAGHAVHGRRRRGRGPDDQLPLDASGRRPGRRPRLQRERQGELGAARRVRHGRRECRDLQGHRREGPPHRRGHVHDQRDPARQQQVQAGASGAAVVLDRYGCRLAERPVDQLHVVASVRRVRRRRLRTESPATASSGLPVAFAVDPASAGVCTSGRRHGVVRRFRHLHDPRRPGRERELPGRARRCSSRSPSSRCLGTDDHVHLERRRGARSTSGRTTTSRLPRARASRSASRCRAPARCRAPRRS